MIILSSQKAGAKRVQGDLLAQPMFFGWHLAVTVVHLQNVEGLCHLLAFFLCSTSVFSWKCQGVYFFFVVAYLTSIFVHANQALKMSRRAGDKGHNSCCRRDATAASKAVLATACYKCLSLSLPSSPICLLFFPSFSVSLQSTTAVAFCA